jgi:hypothetical protein
MGWGDDERCALAEEEYSTTARRKDEKRLPFVWGKLTTQLEQVGRSLPALDSLIAAIALHNGCVLVTRTVNDFIGTGVTSSMPGHSTAATFAVARIR